MAAAPTRGTEIPENVRPRIDTPQTARSRRPNVSVWSARMIAARPHATDPTNPIWKAHRRFSAPGPNGMNAAHAAVATQGRQPPRSITRHIRCTAARWAITTTATYGAYEDRPKTRNSNP
jgi:hypothetical protein